MIGKSTLPTQLRALVTIVSLVVITVSSSIAAAQSLVSDPNYKEGFGKNVTGGAGGATCTVTSTAASGTGTLFACLGAGGSRVGNIIVQFAVTSTQLPQATYLGSNVTIDGCLNGQNGVTFNNANGAKRSIIIENGSNNIILRCLNFRGAGTPASGVTEYDNVTIDGTNSGTFIDGIFVDRCTFYQGSDGSIDLTGNLRNVTVQRTLYYDNAITQLIKYNTRQNISLHHNVYVRNGERNPQVKGDAQLIDYTNNVVYQHTGYYVTSYPDGTPTDPYGVRIWNANSSSDSPGNVIMNMVGNAWIGNFAAVDLITDSGASAGGIYWAPAGTGASNNYVNGWTLGTAPRATPNTIPSGFAITTMAPTAIKAQMLPYIGSPNRTALDQQRLDEVSAALPGSVGQVPSSPNSLTLN